MAPRFHPFVLRLKDRGVERDSRLRTKLLRLRGKTVGVRTHICFNIHAPLGVIRGGSCPHYKSLQKADGYGYHISQMALLPALLDGVSAPGGYDEKER